MTRGHWPKSFGLRTSYRISIGRPLDSAKRSVGFYVLELTISSRNPIRIYTILDVY